MHSSGPFLALFLIDRQYAGTNRVLCKCEGQELPGSGGCEVGDRKELHLAGYLGVRKEQSLPVCCLYGCFRCRLPFSVVLLFA